MAQPAHVTHFARRGLGDPTVDAVLSKGSSGAAVQELQAKLSALGLNVAVTGTYDDATAAAVSQFQQAEGLAVTSTLDPATSARLDQRVLAAQGAAPATPDTVVQQASSAFQALPTWQKGLMVLGGIALVGGIYYVMTKDDEDEGYKRALPGRTVDHDEGVSTRYKVEPERLKRVAGLAGVDDPKRCPRSPDASKFEEGKVVTL